MVAGGLGLTAAAADVSSTPGAVYTPVPNKKVQTIYHDLKPQNLLELKSAKNTHIDRVGGLSSQPWTERVGWPQATFADQRIYEPNFSLVSVSW